MLSSVVGIASVWRMQYRFVMNVLNNRFCSFSGLPRVEATAVS
jgi:hypothetical protein